MHRPPLPPRKDSRYSFLSDAESTPELLECGGKVKSLKNSSDFIGNRTRELTSYSICSERNFALYFHKKWAMAVSPLHMTWKKFQYPVLKLPDHESISIRPCAWWRVRSFTTLSRKNQVMVVQNMFQAAFLSHSTLFGFIFRYFLLFLIIL